MRMRMRTKTKNHKQQKKQNPQTAKKQKKKNIFSFGGSINSYPFLVMSPISELVLIGRFAVREEREKFFNELLINKWVI